MYLLPDDDGLSRQERFITREESTLLCRYMSCKY